MAAALQIPPPDLGDLSLDDVQNTFSRHLTVADGDVMDTRYPQIPHASKHLSLGPQSGPSPQGRMPASSAPRAQSWVDYPPNMSRPSPATWAPSEQPLLEPPELEAQDPREQTEEVRVLDGTSPGAYAPPRSPAHLPYLDTVDDRTQRRSPVTNSPRPSSGGLRLSVDPNGALQQNPEMGQRPSGIDQYRETPSSGNLPPVSPQLPSVVTAGLGPASGPSTPNIPPAGPSYSTVPISSRPRAYAQQPTYVNPSNAPANGMYGPQMAPKEEVCVECAMRDQDMADVDVTSPGIWERESDALYEDLLRREEEDEAAGLPPQENASRPRARGQRLTEEHLKLWTSMNPKEPTSRQQTLDQYVKAQRSLIEAEALAHARALRESRQLDDRMRDAYSQLRRSAYELGSSAQPSDDTGGVRIKSPRSPSGPAPHNHNHSREVTLLENGMIVEHVDVRREEREERDRRRREEKRERSRVRKTSRSSRTADVMSVYSLQTPLHTDSGFFSGVRSDSRYSQSISASARPSSVMTAGGDRHTIPRAQSQASFSDMQSVGSAASPRRSRFFGLKNLSAGFRSQDSLAPSGSMIDMHVALQREQQYFQSMHPEAVDIGSNAPTVRLGDSWAGAGEQASQPEAQTKKAKGLKKIWKLVTGATHKGDAHAVAQSRTMERAEDDLPLAPPPPLSYLVNRDGSSSRRHVSTPSLPSSASPYTLSPYAASPPTAPSSLMPSPTSSRRSTADKEAASDGRKNSEAYVGTDMDELSPIPDSAYPDSDSRGRTTQSSRTLSSGPGPLTPPLPSASPSHLMAAPPVLRRDKSLPPLPGEGGVEFPNVHMHPLPDMRPQTVFTYDPRTIVDGLSPPQAPFRTAETRRQSFGGVGSKPHMSQTMPGARGGYGRNAVPSFLAEEKYGEFGMQQRVQYQYGQWPAAQYSQGSLAVPGDKVKKRKSKFGLGSLFGRKSNEAPVRPAVVQPGEYGTYAPRASQHSEMPFESVMPNGGMSGYASPMTTGSHVAPRMSIVSRRNVDELVEQDPEFIAYRYPSNDQRLDLMR